MTESSFRPGWKSQVKDFYSLLGILNWSDKGFFRVTHKQTKEKSEGFSRSLFRTKINFNISSDFLNLY